MPRERSGAERPGNEIAASETAVPPVQPAAEAEHRPGRGLPPAWSTEARRLAWILAASLLIGLSFDAWAQSLLAGLTAFLGWHFYQLVRLVRELQTGKKLRAPLPAGLWEQVGLRMRFLHMGAKRRKRRLSRFVRRFHDAAAALPDAALVLGRGDRLEWANPAAEHLLGVSWPQFGGKRLGDLLRDALLEEYLRSGDQSTPLILPSPVNEALVLSLRVTPFGKKHQRLVMARDITRVYHLEQAQRDFVGNVSHELRTPLTVISGFLETLSDASEECPQWGRAVELMGQQTARMQNLVSDLLMLSRLEMGDRAPSHEPVSVAELLQTVMHEAQVLSGPARHHLELDCDEGLWLCGDAEELRSVFSNLVQNAVRHTPAGTEVRVSWKADPHAGVFSVTDNGPGIPSHHLPRLTERFYRVDKARSRKSGSTGLGLSIVRQILERHGGELRVLSEVGRGSSFICAFPAAVLARAEELGQEPPEKDSMADRG